MKLSVVIVNYNVKYYLEQCLRSLQRAIAGVDGENISNLDFQKLCG